LNPCPSEYKIWFFAGGETRDNRFNLFTGSFIRLLKQIFTDDFDFIKGIFYKSNARNVIWALNNSQIPFLNPENEKIITAAFTQITSEVVPSKAQLIIISSSTGSVVAAQTACYLAQKNNHKEYFTKPFHLVLGASMISSQSDLFKILIRFQKEGQIGVIIQDEIQDEGDNSNGVGGQSKLEAYRNAFGIMFPFLSKDHFGPSFLNTDPETGHIHRRRSKTIQKAIDYINIIFIKNNLAGDNYKEKALKVLLEEKFHL
jgi:hypothetical protein